MELNVNGEATSTSTSTSTEDDEKDVISTPNYDCGLGSCNPSCFQKFNNPIAALVFLCWFALVEGFIVNGITNANTTTWEVRYGFSSTEVSLITVFYDVAAGLLVLPITYFGANAHQMKILSVCALIMGCGSIIICIPQWASGIYNVGERIQLHCDTFDNTTSGECSNQSGGKGGYLANFIIANILHCLGGTALYSIGIVYIDSNAMPGPSAFRQGILYAVSTLGPAIGFILGGYFLSLYVDIDRMPSSRVTITSDDPRWVGAWWLGYLIGAACAFSVFIILLCYPKEFRSTESVRKQRLSASKEKTPGLQQLDGDTGDFVDHTEMPKLKDVPKVIGKLTKNGVFVFVSLASALELFLVAGTAVFLSQLIQFQFYQKAGTAAIIGGALAIPGTVIGQVVGGYLCRKFSLDVRGMLRFCLVCTIVSLALIPSVLARCPTTILAGVSQPYNSTASTQINLTNQCNSHCSCTTYSYDPLCDDNTGLQYFSACYAGCAELQTNITGEKTSPQIFHNCTCVPSSSNRSLTYGQCEAAKCSMLYIFIPFFLLLIIDMFLITVPALNVTLRCVAEHERSFAIGVQWCMMRFLGSVPGPLIFGVVFDSACILWQEGCGALGTCWVTDNDALAYRFLILFMIIQIVAFILFGGSYLVNEKLMKGSVKAASQISIIKDEENEQKAKLPSQSNGSAILDNITKDNQSEFVSSDASKQLSTANKMVSPVKYQSRGESLHSATSYDNPVSTDDE